ncbi:MAG: thioredoxin domain-containing protein [bacterium]|nr:thioredoxin domain-containing protein [bacterium]
MPPAIRPNRKKPLSQQSAPTIKSPTKTSNDYIEIHLPKVRFQDSPLSPLWVILLVIFAFLLGMTTTKIQYLQQGGTTSALQNAQAGNTQGQQEITLDTVKGWAKDLRLDTNKFNQCIDQEKYKDLIDKDIADAITASAEATPTFYINGKRVVGAVPFAQFKTALDSALSGTDEGTKTEVALGHLPPLGKDTAPVTMIEFSDLQCPFCLRFFQDSFPQIKKEYIDTGKVKFYYRQLPLIQLHPMAMSYAHATECANEQGKFWEMHDEIFTEQGQGQS